jgi:beta-lactam-binding protein with PASTA domain
MNKNSIYITAIGLVTALIVSSVGADVLSAAPELVRVPYIVGESREQAERDLSRAGLSARIILQSSRGIFAGDVISQKPRAGVEVASKTTINLVVSSGETTPAGVELDPSARKKEAALQTVPFVVGQSQGQAERDIFRKGLKARIRSQANNAVPEGEIISQSPAAGTQVAPTSIIDLVVSSGESRIAIPDLVGKTQAYAEVELSRSRLGSSIASENSDTVAAGRVIRQNPAAGEQVRSESIVDLVVSSGTSKIAIPDLAGQSRDGAVFVLGKSGLVLGKVAGDYDDSIAKGRVIRQRPAAGSMVSADSPVDILVSQGSAPKNAEVRDEVKVARNDTGSINLNVEDKPLIEVLRQIENDSGIRIKIPEILGEEHITAQVVAPNWDQAIRKLLKGFSVMEVSDENENLVAIWVMTSRDIGETSRAGFSSGSKPRASDGKKGRRGINPESLERMKKKLRLGRSLSPTFYSKLKDLVAWPKGQSVPGSLLSDAEMKDFFEVNGIKSEEDLSKTGKIDHLKKAARRQMLTMEKRAKAQKVKLE